MKFKLWIEIRKLIDQDKDSKWVISYCVHTSNIYKKELFIENYPIKSYAEDNKICYYQEFNFNKKLHKLVQKLLFPKSNKNSILVSKEEAWDYYHYTLYVGGFIFAVHPVSIGNDFIRVEFEGTQEDIYNKCLELNKKYLNNE